MSRFSLSLLIVALALAAVVVFQKVAVYLLLAVVVMLLGRPITRLLGRLRLPSGLSAGVSLLLMYGTVGGVVAVLVPVLGDQTQNLATVNFDELQTALRPPIKSFERFARRYHLRIPLEKHLKEQSQSLISAASVVEGANGLVDTAGEFFLGLFAVTFVAFFLLKDGDLFENIVWHLTPAGYEAQVLDVLQQVRVLLTRYLLGILLDAVLVGTLVTLGLTLLNVPNALLIGVLAGALNVIPYIGPVAGFCFAMAFTILGNLQMDFYTQLSPLLLGVGVVFSLVQVLDGFILQPTIYANTVRAHPMEIFLVILMAGTIGGIGAMVLAIPTYTIVRVAARAFLSQFHIVQALTRNMR